MSDLSGSGISSSLGAFCHLFHTEEMILSAPLIKLYRLWTWWNQFIKSVRHHDAVTVIKLVILEQAVPVELVNLKTFALI
jgi:hypothetical protein